MRDLNSKDMLEILRERVEEAGSQRQLAKDLGFTVAFINDVLHGRRYVTKKLARKLGYIREIVFIQTFRKASK